MTDFYGQGRIAGCDVEFLVPHREANRSQVVLRAEMTVPLSVEDIIAVLWEQVEWGLKPSDLDNAEFARQVVFESLLSSGIEAVMRAQETIRAMTPDHADYQALTELRARVSTLFGAAVPPQRGSVGRARRDLVEVRA